jgi:hydroxylysine kinase
VHGIPGFESGDEAEEVSFPAITGERAIAIADEVYGISATRARRLETERDDTFRLTTADGDVVLKAAHPADTAAALDLQVQAVQHAARADAALPLQRILPSRSGELTPETGGRVVRLLSWMPGTELLHARPDDAQLALLGTALGRLSLALRDFEHPVAHHVYAWDLLQAPRRRALLDRFPNEAASIALDRFDRNVAPRLHELPRQVIHNDFNPGNVLVDAADPAYVAGILDFGDVVHSARVADLAVAICYQLFPLEREWSTVLPLIEGFDRIVPLKTVEIAVLADLVAVRFAQRALINEWLALKDESHARDPKFRRQNFAALAAFLDQGA